VPPPPDVIVELATPDSSDEIASVKVTGFRTTYSPWVSSAALEPMLDEPRVAAGLRDTLAVESNFALLARRGGSCIGIAVCLVAGRDEPLLDSFHVLPEARGTGIGAVLLVRLADELVERGVRALTVGVLEPNVRTVELYERLGAQQTSIAPARWAPDETNEVWYRWPDLHELRRMARSRY
jgi:ribosomal protein S18 acetylase RimI-like enzyme